MDQEVLSSCLKALLVISLSTPSTQASFWLSEEAAAEVDKEDQIEKLEAELGWA